MATNQIDVLNPLADDSVFGISPKLAFEVNAKTKFSLLPVVANFDH